MQLKKFNILFLLLGAILLTSCGKGFIVFFLGPGDGEHPGFIAIITPGNFHEGGRLFSGVLTGTVSSKERPVASVRASFDGGSFKRATGTTSWSVRLPTITRDGIIWPTSSVHVVVIQALDGAGGIIGQLIATVKKGINKDYNCDGYSDLLVSSQFSDITFLDGGMAFVYFGSPLGSNPIPHVLPNPLSDTGHATVVASAGDVNGDGCADALVSNAFAPSISPGGVVFLYLGSPSGLNPTPHQVLVYPGVDSTTFGDSLSSAGDVNGDGFDDVIIGAIHSNFFPTTLPAAGVLGAGAAFLYHGNAFGVSTAHDTAFDYPGGGGEAFNAVFSIAVSSAGDANGDGFADVVIGSNAADITGVDFGAAFVYLGSASGIPSTGPPAPSAIPDTILDYPPAVAGSEFGFRTDLADVNGDGFDDTVVAATSSPLGAPGGGAAFVFPGSAGGVSTTVLSTVVYPFATTGAQMGRGIAAGDINRDGFEDLVLGAPGPGFVPLIVTTPRGAVFVFFGTAGGLGVTPGFILPSPHPRSQDADSFGVSVTAGDVNGDGFPDVMVSAPEIVNVLIPYGYVANYHGSPGGLGLQTIPGVGIIPNQFVDYPGTDPELRPASASPNFGFTID